MRRAWLKLLVAPLVGACGLVAGIEDVTVVDLAESDGGQEPRDDSGNPILPDGFVPPTDGPVDTGIDVPASTRCSPLKPFGAPVAIAALNTTADDASARLSQDELTVYFSSTRPGHLGGGSIYTATRGTPTGTFGTPTLMPVINTAAGTVYHPTITGDGLRIFLQVQGGGPTDIYLGTRGSTMVDFGTPAPLANVNSAGFEFLPTITADGNTLYFSSNRNGSFLLYQSVAAAGVFGAPTLLAGVGSGDAAVADTAPVMSSDQLSIYFASTRTNPASAAYDLFVARRMTPTGPFAAATLVTELNDANAGASDLPSWLSPDDCRLYMTSDRLTAGGASDVYVATRTP